MFLNICCFLKFVVFLESVVFWNLLLLGIYCFWKYDVVETCCSFNLLFLKSFFFEICCFLKSVVYLICCFFLIVKISQNIFVLYIDNSFAPHFHQRQVSSVVESWLHTQEIRDQFPPLATIFCWGYTNRLSVSSIIKIIPYRTWTLHSCEEISKFYYEGPQ